MNTPLHLLTVTTVAFLLTFSSTLHWAAVSRDRVPTSAPNLPPDPPLIRAMQYIPPRSPKSDSRVGQRISMPVRGYLRLNNVRSDRTLDNLVALVPEIPHKNVSSVSQVWGLTASAHPTLWFYIPFRSDSIHAIEFLVLDEQDQDIYRTSVSIPRKSEIVGVTLPTTVTLQPGKGYHWFVEIYSRQARTHHDDPSDTSAIEPPEAVVDGWIERNPLEPSLISQLRQLSASQQAALYAEKGFWFDAVTALAIAKQSKTETLTVTANWRALLQQVGLEKLATQPVAMCCQAK